MATVENTLAFIRSHGFFAAETNEGVLALMDCSRSRSALIGAGMDETDGYFNEPAVFPIIDGNVSTRDVRAWLGY